MWTLYPPLLSQFSTALVGIEKRGSPGIEPRSPLSDRSIGDKLARVVLTTTPQGQRLTRGCREVMWTDFGDGPS